MAQNLLLWRSYGWSLLFGIPQKLKRNEQNENDHIKSYQYNIFIANPCIRITIKINKDMELLYIIQYNSYLNTIRRSSRLRWEWTSGKEIFLVLRQRYRDDYQGFNLETERYSLKVSTSSRF